MVRSIREYFKKTKFGNFVAPAVLGLLLFYFYVNGAILFGPLWGGFQSVILLYILGLFLAFAIAPILLTYDPKAPLWLEAVAYIVPAVVINVVLWFAGIRSTNLGPTSSNPVPVILL